MQSDPWFLVNKVLSLYYFDEIRRLRIQVKDVLFHEQLPAFPSVNFSDALAGCQEPCCWRGCCCSHGQRCKCVAAQSLYFRDVRMEPASCREVTWICGVCWVRGSQVGLTNVFSLLLQIIGPECKIRPLSRENSEIAIIPSLLLLKERARNLKTFSTFSYLPK